MDVQLDQSVPPRPGTFNIRRFSPLQLNAIRTSLPQNWRWNRHLFNIQFQNFLKDTMKNQCEEIIAFHKRIESGRRYKLNSEMQYAVMPAVLANLRMDIKPCLLDFSRSKNKLNWDLMQNVKNKSFNNQEMLMAMPSSISMEKISGMQRLKYAFLPWFFNPLYNRQEAYIYNFNWRYILNTSLTTGALIGVFKGITHGVVFMKSFEKIKNNFVFEGQKDAASHRKDSFQRGFVRYFYRWGWRTSVLSGIFLTVSEGLTIYNMEFKTSNYIAGGFAAPAIYKWTKGPLKMISWGLLGVLISGLICPLLVNSNYNFRAMQYFVKIDHRVSSPYYYRNESENELNIAEAQLKEIIQLASIGIPCDEVEVTNKIKSERLLGKIDWDKNFHNIFNL